MVFLDSTCRYTKYIKTRLLRLFRVYTVCRYSKIHETHRFVLVQYVGTPRYTKHFKIDYFLSTCRHNKIHETCSALPFWHFLTKMMI